MSLSRSRPIPIVNDESLYHSDRGILVRNRTEAKAGISGESPGKPTIVPFRTKNPLNILGIFELF